MNHLIELAHELANLQGMTPVLLAQILATAAHTAEFMTAEEVDRRLELADLQVRADGRRTQVANAPAVKPRTARKTSKKTQPSAGEVAIGTAS